MALGPFAHGALAELTLDDLGRMFELDETLFVEHKSDLNADSAHQLTRAVASFANTMCGWLLIGVRDPHCPSPRSAGWPDRVRRDAAAQCSCAGASSCWRQGNASGPETSLLPE